MQDAAFGQAKDRGREHDAVPLVAAATATFARMKESLHEFLQWRIFSLRPIHSRDSPPPLNRRIEVPSLFPSKMKAFLDLFLVHGMECEFVSETVIDLNHRGVTLQTPKPQRLHFKEVGRGEAKCLLSEARSGDTQEVDKGNDI